MTTLPLQAFFAKAAAAANSVAANENKADKNTLSVQSNGKKYTNNNSEQNVTKFTIGTSDEEESNDEDNSRDLEKLFCPLTDKNGAPFDSQGEIVSSSNCRRVQSEIMASVSRIKSSILGRKGGFLHTYAMLESNDTGGSVPVSLNTSPQHNPTVPVKQKKSLNENNQSHSQKPKLKNSRSQGSLKLRSKSPGPILMRDSITVSLPSPAGNR
eukprot:01919.XXX_12416_13374_1 [CDS] Oithona nana genome sequencing.